jgi:ornithine cyclodeaminase/alanine dehydrogenase
MTLVLGELDVNALTEMTALISVLENGQIEHSRGKVVQPMRSRVTISPYPGFLDIMPGYVKKSDALSVKVLTSRKNNREAGRPVIYATVLLIDARSGRLMAIMDGGSVTAIRTAAVSGVATRYLARKDARSLAVIGTGRQARTHLWSMLNVRPIEKIIAHDHHIESAERFKQEMENRFHVKIVLVESVEDAVKTADIVVLSTTTTDPVLRGDWLREGMHINSIASATPNVRELDTTAIKKSKVVVDSKEVALLESGDILIPISEGEVTSGHIHAEVGEIAAGKKPGRLNDQEITLYKSMGLAIQDTAAANWLYQKAREHGRGIEVNI